MHDSYTQMVMMDMSLFYLFHTSVELQVIINPTLQAPESKPSCLQYL